MNVFLYLYYLCSLHMVTLLTTPFLKFLSLRLLWNYIVFLLLLRSFLRNFLPGISFLPSSFRVIVLPEFCSSSQVIWVISSIYMSLTPIYMLMASESISSWELCPIPDLYIELSSEHFTWRVHDIHGTLANCWPPHTLSLTYSPILPLY